MATERLWGSRFKESPDEAFIRFISGRDVQGLPPCDELLIPYDLWGSRAHAVMLWKQGIVPSDDARLIVQGLRDIRERYTAGTFFLDPAKEDVHTNVERCLIDTYGLGVGGKLHTGRSRNDQVTVDMILYLRDQALRFNQGFLNLVHVILSQARTYRSTLIPGYTHHQHAMVTTFGHLLFSYAEALYRDIQRFRHWHTLFNANPLGGAASYGTSFPIDRELTAKLLGFDEASASSLDLITNRWEAETEIAYACATGMNHLSGLAQTIILFTTTEFGLITLSDRYCGGSSIMPQKRNPSAMEVTKAKAAVVQGHLASLLSLSRAFFVGYNRDSQWTKYVIMDLIHECIDAPAIMAGVLSTLTVNTERAAELCEEGFITATDLMESLIKDSGIPMRESKMLIERAVKYSDDEQSGVVTWPALQKAIQELNLAISVSAKDIRDRQNPAKIIESRKAIGGPAPAVLLQAIEDMAMKLHEQQVWMTQKVEQIQSAQVNLEALENELFQA
ncbi:MAG TPA: argininosuccinate lyase [Thermodesulfobacteriota bacterium]|nr:argininosuccinate lyase [Deltaproteobacteria bacterium]HNR13239.1 argininosuccinate lyase [Thermodesulfobacteriota bacterium]HNU70618.1 argininosuccinate lyase [Thermodesulfobacteriota bacterium]